jgi:hypothetical protein
VTCIPECLDEFVAEDNPFRIIEAFIDELDLASLSCEKAIPALAKRSMLRASGRMTVASV